MSSSVSPVSIISIIIIISSCRFVTQYAAIFRVFQLSTFYHSCMTKTTQCTVYEAFSVSYHSFVDSNVTQTIIVPAMAKKSQLMQKALAAGF